MLTHALRISLLGMVLVASPAMAKAPIPDKKLNQIADVHAFTTECSNRRLVGQHTFAELNDIILEISFLPTLEMDTFIEYRVKKQNEIASMDDGELLRYCTDFRKNVIRISMMYWELYKKAQ